jgi:hypothetical protein
MFPSEMWMLRPLKLSPKIIHSFYDFFEKTATISPSSALLELGCYHRLCHLLPDDFADAATGYAYSRHWAKLAVDLDSGLEY